MREIPIVGGHVAFVDDADAKVIGAYRWHICGKYPASKIDGRKLLMHRFLIQEVPDGMVIDHIDGNRLNNQRANLRIVTASQNALNRHAADPSRRHHNNKLGYHGVVQRRAKFYGQIRVQGCAFYTKSCATPLEAAAAWDVLAIKHYGEFATLNFPSGEASDA